MVKKIVISISASLMLSANSFNIEIKKDSWNLIGTAKNLNISELNLSKDDIIWQYKNKKWLSNQDTNNQYGQVSNFDANDGFWLYSTTDKNIIIENNGINFTSIATGWNLYSPSSDIDLNKDINSSFTPIIWGYKNGEWKLFNPLNIYKNTKYSPLTIIKKGEGVWVYNYKINTPKLIRKTTDNLEDIWNISFKINKDIDYNNLDIGVKFLKYESDGTPDIGKFICHNLSIEKGIISKPDTILIEGIGDSGSTTDTYDKNWKPQLLDNTILLNDNIITINLADIMKSQVVVKESTFKAKTTYKIFITSNNENLIQNGVEIEEFELKYLNLNNTKGIIGEMEIK